MSYDELPHAPVYFVVYERPCTPPFMNFNIGNILKVIPGDWSQFGLVWGQECQPLQAQGRSVAVMTFFREPENPFREWNDPNVPKGVTSDSVVPHLDVAE